MFRKLRNKFLMLNIVIISIMMLIAFASIYVIMYQNQSRAIDMELHRLSDSSRKSAGSPGRSRPNPNHSPTESTNKGMPPLERSISFAVLVDKQSAIKSVFSPYDMGLDFYNEAKNMALAGKDKGKLKLEGNHWAYLVQPIPDGYTIAFLDITSQQSFLSNLVYTFLIVASVMLVIIFFISRFFANRSIQPVQEAFEKQKQFIADASHELKTPLTIINTNVDVMLAHAEDTIQNQSKWLSFIKSESERLARLTNDLLYLTQIDQANTTVMFAPFQVSEAVEQVVLAMEAVIYESNISLSYEIEPDLISRGSNEQFKQVVMILLDNAMKYTNPSGSVSVTLKKRLHDIVLTVTNTGEGISEEHLERIFDRFYRTDPSRARKHGGYGLGLAIAKAIVDQHRGRIYAKSVKDEVSFFVELPVGG